MREAPVRIELTNSRFAVCRLTTWPRRRATKLSGPEPPEQSGSEDPERQSSTENKNQYDDRDRHKAEYVVSLARRTTSGDYVTLEQRHIHHVRLPSRVEEIADGRD